MQPLEVEPGRDFLKEVAVITQQFRHKKCSLRILNLEEQPLENGHGRVAIEHHRGNQEGSQGLRLDGGITR